MGDKGGKKDKAKHQQQQVKKHQEDEQKKRNKGPDKAPGTRNQPGAVTTTPRV